MSATAQLENFWYYGVSIENSYLAVPRPTLTLNDMLNKKKLYAQNDVKLCSQVINTLTYHASRT